MTIGITYMVCVGLGFLGLRVRRDLPGLVFSTLYVIAGLPLAVGVLQLWSGWRPALGLGVTDLPIWVQGALGAVIQLVLVDVSLAPLTFPNSRWKWAASLWGCVCVALFFSPLLLLFANLGPYIPAGSEGAQLFLVQSGFHLCAFGLMLLTINAWRHLSVDFADPVVATDEIEDQEIPWLS